MILKNKFLTASLLLLVSFFLMMSCSDSPSSPDSDDSISEQEQKVLDKASTILPEDLLQTFSNSIDNNTTSNDREEYLDTLEVAVSEFVDSLNKYHSLEEFKQTLDSIQTELDKEFEKELSSFNKLPCSDNLGLGFSKGGEINAEISGSVATVVNAELSAKGGGGIEFVYDFVNMDRGIYTYSFCGIGGGLSLGLGGGISGSLGYTGLRKWLWNIQQSSERDRFEGASRSYSIGVSGALIKKIGLKGSINVGYAQELEVPDEAGTFLENLTSCPSYFRKKPKHGGVKELSFSGSISGGIGLEIVAALQGERMGAISTFVDDGYKNFGVDKWGRQIAGFRMAKDVLIPEPLEGFTTGGTAPGAAALITIYSLFQPSDCSSQTYVPDIVTKEVTDITTNSVTTGGKVNSNGGESVTEIGVCWSEESYPTLEDECLSSDSDSEEFTTTISGLISDVEYYVRSYAVNRKGTGYGDVLSFKTKQEENQPPTVEIIDGPTDGETIDYTNPQFEWNGSDEDGSVDEYSVELNGPVSEDFTTTDNNYQFEGLSNGDYTFRVRAMDNEGAQSAWASREFTVAVDTENQPPTVEITGGPSDGETIEYTDPEFEWQGSDEDGSIDEYSVELNGPDSEEFTINNTGHQFQDLAYGDYEFRVRAIDNEGAKSAWASREFTVEESTTRPVVTTLEVSSITATSAESGGDVTDDGGDEVSLRGVCWSTSETPDVDDDCTNDGGGTGEFTSLLEDLTSDTKYYVRAYAVNKEGIGYGDVLSFRTNEEDNQSPTVEITGGPSDGETIDHTNPEFEWDGSDEDGSIEEYRVELDGPDSEEFATDDTDHQFEDLSYGDYEFRVRAIDNEGSKSAWASREFTVQKSATRPTVTTLEVSSITATSAKSGGDVTDNGVDEVSVRGVCWSTSETPDVDADCTNDGGGTGEFTSLLEDLSPNTKYYVRAYAVNIEGIGYGDILSFRTNEEENDPPTVDITSGPSDGETIDYTNPEFTWEGSDADGSVDEYRVELNGPDSEGFTTNDTFYQFEGLSYGDYEFRVRAVDNDGANSEWASREFTIEQDVTTPTVTTSEISSITTTSAQSGGDVTDNGGDEVSIRGVCWSMSQDPDVNDDCTNDGGGEGEFTSLIEDLSPDTEYYVRAYAVNIEGIGYGDQRSFSTESDNNDWPRDTDTEVVDVTNPETGKTWMDRNLGASRAATSSTDEQAYGDLYQWGRPADGHQKRNSGTTTTLSSSDQPGHDDFILAPNDPDDWRSPQNDNLWQGVNGVNNPCPSGYRLPTDAELDAERKSWSSNDADGAFASPLKLPLAGLRNASSGSLDNVGSLSYYWSSVVAWGKLARNLNFISQDAGVGSSFRASGRSVRCIKN